MDSILFRARALGEKSQIQFQMIVHLDGSFMWNFFQLHFFFISKKSHGHVFFLQFAVNIMFAICLAVERLNVRMIEFSHKWVGVIVHKTFSFCHAVISLQCIPQICLLFVPRHYFCLFLDEGNDCSQNNCLSVVLVLIEWLPLILDMVWELYVLEDAFFFVCITSPL